jgi:hypothetical protein
MNIGGLFGALTPRLLCARTRLLCRQAQCLRCRPVRGLEQTSADVRIARVSTLALAITVPTILWISH